MKNKSVFLSVVILFSYVFFILGCGGGGGSSDSETGSDLNSDWALEEVSCTGTVTGGTFSESGGSGASVYVKDGVLPACSNVTEASTLTTTASLSDGFDIKSSEGDTNVTSGATGYVFDLNGDRGFSTTDAEAVTITLPFDSSQVPAGDLTGIKVFVRIFSDNDSSLVDVIGTVNSGLITVETRGLPEKFTAAVIYNPNMTYISSEEAAEPSISASFKNVTNNPPWPARRWLVAYNPASAALITSVQNVLGIVVAPTTEQIQTVINSKIVEVAKSNQEIYEAAGFRAPNLSIVPFPISIVPFTMADHYIIHIIDGGSIYQPQDPGEVVSPDGNPFGRVYIGAGRIDDDNTNTLGTITASIAHETLHAIQDGYELIETLSLRGMAEGTATIYGFTIDHSDTITVRSNNAAATFLLSNFLMSTGLLANGFPEAYANQDFFAYVGNKYASGDLTYISGMLEKVRTDIDDVSITIPMTSLQFILGYKSIRSTMYSAMDSYFHTTFGETLKDLYLDFLKQRAFEHNAESQFGRAGETVNGFAENLFANAAAGSPDDGIIDVEINADDCSMTHEWGLFGSVAPLAARAVKITTSTVSTAAIGPTITVTFAPGTGSIGDTWQGFSYRNGSASEIIDGDNAFTDFGRSANDSISFAIANMNTGLTNLTNSLLSSYVSYRVECEPNGGGGGGTNTFTFSTTMPNVTFSPQYIWPASSPSSVSFILTEEDSSSPDFLATQYLLVQLDTLNITGAGTYDVTSCYSVSPGSVVNVMYASLSTLTMFCSSSGTVDLTSFGSTSGSRITGTMTATMENTLSLSETGKVDMTFDFYVP